MIYLIGGPPKCGKTTFAKRMSKQTGIQWVASDTLQVVAREYVSEYVSDETFDNLYPHTALKGKNNDETYSTHTPQNIANAYIAQAKATYNAIDMFTICELIDGNDYIIEGYHVTPELAEVLIEKYGAEKIRVMFILKSDIEKFIENVKHSSTPNDWILAKTHEEETFRKIAEMVKHFSDYILEEANSRSFKVLNMDDDFDDKIDKGIKYLLDKS